MPEQREWLLAIAGIVLFLLGSYAAVQWLLPLVIPFALAALLAEVINPVVDALTIGLPLGGQRRLRLPRSLATLLVLVILAGLAGFITTLAVARIVREINALLAALPYYYALGMDLARDLITEFGAFSQTLPDYVLNTIGGSLEEARGNLEQILRPLVGTLQAFAGLPALLTNLLVLTIATFFISRDRQVIGRFFLGLFPPSIRGKVRRVKDDVWTAAMGYAKAQALLITGTAILSIVGLSVIGLDYALTMGLVVGVADLLPVLGPGAIYIPWAVVALASGHPALALKLLILYGVLVGVRQVLEPKLVGEQTGLHPLTILFTMYIGFQFFGALGVVIGPLLAILLKAMIQSDLLPIFPGSDHETGSR